jgi:hypothetical protein
MEALAKRAGEWEGLSRLWTMPGAPASESRTRATVFASKRARFIRIDYSWTEPGGEPEEGSLVLVSDSEGSAEVHWTDSWHCVDHVMVLRGTLRQDGALEVKGAYPAPEGPDWGWTIAVHAADPRSLRITMHNIPPGSEPVLAVEAAYSRAER